MRSFRGPLIALAIGLALLIVATLLDGVASGRATWPCSSGRPRST